MNEQRHRLADQFGAIRSKSWRDGLLVTQPSSFFTLNASCFSPSITRTHFGAERGTTIVTGDLTKTKKRIIVAAQVFTMEDAYFRTDSSGPVRLLCTQEDGRIDYSLLGQLFKLDPTSILLNGVGISRAKTWKQIMKFFERDRKPVGTEAEPVIVTSERRVHGGSAEGEPFSKKTKRSPDEFQFSVPAIREHPEAVAVAMQSYFKKLLEAPLDLPKSVEALREFLSTRTIKLPVLLESTYSAVGQPDLVELCTSEAQKPFAIFVKVAFEYMSMGPPVNEATSSARLFYVTGHFLQYLNRHAPADSGLLGLSAGLDSTDARGTSALSALQTLKGPDCLLFVREALILRWENKFDASDVTIAMEENASKLRVWSPLYYGTLPFVIGGCSGGGLFRWLKLSPNGKRIAVDPISPFYDLNMLSGVALLLHSTIRMHCLLQKLQEELPKFPPVKLYRPIPRSGGGEVIVYPECVHKTVMPPLPNDRCCMLELLYDSIKGSKYLIQLISIRAVQKKTIIQLQPVGDPNAWPCVLKDLEAAVHDILHGLVDLHNKGYTHRDLRWENFIKVNVQGEWKWVIIDLEAAGVDEEGLGNGLRSWDAGTLQDRDGKKIYTKGSDMYQLGKLIVEWLDTSGKGGEEELAMRAWGENMQQERGAAAKMLEDTCMEGCERCGKFDT